MKIGVTPNTPENSHSTMFEASVRSVCLDNTALIVAPLFIYNLSGLQVRCYCLCCGLLKVIVAPLLNFDRQVCKSHSGVCAAAC